MRTLKKTVAATERYVRTLFVRVCFMLGDVSRKFVIVADDEHDPSVHVPHGLLRPRAQLHGRDA